HRGAHAGRRLGRVAARGPGDPGREGGDRGGSRRRGGHVLSAGGDLADRVAIVTGAGGGLGSEIASRLVALCAVVVMSNIAEDRLATAVAATAPGARAPIAHVADVSSPSSVPLPVETVVW